MGFFCVKPDFIANYIYDYSALRPTNSMTALIPHPPILDASSLNHLNMQN